MELSATRERVLLAACLTVLAVLVVVDIAAGNRLTVSGTYGLSPVLAGALLGIRPTAVCGIAASAASGLSFLWNENIGPDWAVRFAIVLVLSLTAVAISVSRGRRERSLARMTHIADVAQRAVLRAIPPAVGPVGFAARYVSAAEEARIGGDLYEVVPTDFGTRAIVGDVKGKGLDAVQLAATVLAAFRRSAPLEADLVTVARELDVVVTAVAGDEDFVTAVLVEFGEGGVLRVVNLGHLPPLLVDATEDGARVLDTGEPVPPLGLHPRPTLVTGSWTPGMRLLLYTDGTTEGRDRDGRFFELTAAAAQLRTGSLDEALDRLVAALTRHVGHAISDDVALVLAENRHPSPG